MRGKIGKNPNSKVENQFKRKKNQKMQVKIQKKIYDNFKGENRKIKKKNEMKSFAVHKIGRKKKKCKKNVGKIAGQV